MRRAVRREPRIVGVAVAAALILAWGASSPARAQLSPGPLADPHHHLEGVENCLECHGLGETELDPHCLECHTEIAKLLEDGRGFHGLEARSDCAGCHPDHGGRDFELIEWPRPGKDGFDHRRAGWPLEGKHAEVACEKCHREDLRKSPVAKLRPGGLGAQSWLGLETDCASCHEDPHVGRLGSDCVSCHSPADWKKITEEGFDHDRTAWPLSGGHREVQCAKCHDPVTAWGPKPKHARCTDCHEDAHAGQATLAGKAVDCDACHSDRWFKPSTYTVTRHRDSPFPLEDAHAKVGCEACHPTSTGARAEAKLGKARLVLRLAHDTCTDCHVDAHAGQLAARPDGGACTACHDQRAFRPSRFGVAEHRETKMPLTGPHEKAECRACHGPDRRHLPALPGEDRLGSARIAFHPEASDCDACHRDPHGGRFSSDGERPFEDSCRACHGETTFGITEYDVAAHAASRFPLEGAHRAVPCFDCHRELMREAAASTLLLAPGGATLKFEIANRGCVDCHDDPHGGQFSERAQGDDCASCHGIDAFAPAPGFRHDDAAFALDGSHANVACAKCHVAGALPNGAIGIVYRPVAHRCEDCHANLSPDAFGKDPR